MYMSVVPSYIVELYSYINILFSNAVETSKIAFKKKEFYTSAISQEKPKLVS